MTHALPVASDPAGPRGGAAVTVRLVYLARLREAFGRALDSVVLPADAPATLATVVAVLRARGGAFEQELAAGRAYRLAVNHTMAGDAASVRDGDEVAIFPPVTGG